MGVQVKFVNACSGEVAEKAVADLEMGEVLILENLRFHKEETAGDETFAKQLSALGDVYINDAFELLIELMHLLQLWLSF